MSSTSTKKSNPNNNALRSLLKQAKAYCDEATMHLSLDKAVAHISSRFDELTPEQRRELQEIGQIMTASNATPIAGMSQPGSFELNLTQDRMHMLLTVRPPLAGGKAVDTREVVDALKERNVQTGVNMPRITAALQAAAQGQEQVDVTIVQGRDPIPGKDGRVHLFARRNLNQPLEKAPVDSLEIDQSAQLLCKKDDCILIHELPQEGRAGHDAVGQPIEAPPVSDVTITPGEHIHVDENRMVAKITGMIKISRNVISILPVLYFPEDVTTAQGKIDFKGQIIVKGNVRAGVSMVATDDITIHGNVEAACINSVNQSVIIKQGIVGRGEALITAAKDITARFVENASLRADGCVLIENGAMHSHIVAGDRLDVTKGKGHLVGGSSLAGNVIAVRILGTTSGQKTQVAAGISARAMKVITRLDMQTHKLTNSLQQCREIIESIYHLVRDPSKMDNQMLEQLSRLKQLQLVLQVRHESLQKRRERVMNHATKQGEGKIEILEDVYSGLTVRIGKQELLYTDTARARQFVMDMKTNKIVCQPLKR